MDGGQRCCPFPFRPLSSLSVRLSCQIFSSLLYRFKLSIQTLQTVAEVAETSQSQSPGVFSSAQIRRLCRSSRLVKSPVATSTSISHCTFHESHEATKTAASVHLHRRNTHHTANPKLPHQCSHHRSVESENCLNEEQRRLAFPGISPPSAFSRPRSFLSPPSHSD